MIIGVKQSSITHLWHDVTWSETTGAVEVNYPLSKSKLFLGTATTKEDAVEVAMKYSREIGDEFKRKFW